MTNRPAVPAAPIARTRLARTLALIVALLLSTPLLAQMSTAPADCGPSGGGATECASAGPATPGNTSGTELGAGNPINVVSGNKYQREVDLPALPGVLGLEIVRHYNSAQRGLGQIGRGWRLSYETDLYAIGPTVQIVTADGQRLIFERDPLNPALCASANPADGRMVIERVASGQDRYRWIWPNGRVLDFDADGRLVQIQAPSGEFVSLTRGPRGELLRVTDPQGRSLALHYARPEAAGFKGIVAIDSPVGRFEYAHASDGPGVSNLLSVSTPDGGQRHYHYEAERQSGHPHALTGISQTLSEGGKLQRLATWAYDAEGRAVLSAKGEPRRLDEAGRPVPGTGIEQVELAFVKPSLPDGVPGETVLTNSLGQTTDYRHAQIGGQYRLLEARGPGCASCGETDVRYGYDRHGALTEKTKLDAAGLPLFQLRWTREELGRVTQLQRQDWAAGKPGPVHLIERREYAGAHDGPRLIARPSVVPGKEHLVRIEYNEHGQPVRMTESGFSPLDETGEVAASADAATPIERTTTYAYATINARSLLTEIDGPLPNGPTNDPSDSDITRFTWDAMGNRIVGVTHPMGLTETFDYALAGANPTGLMVARVDVNGVRMELQMRADGRPERIARGPREVLIDYDAEGRPVRYRANDGRTAQIEYRDDGTVRYTLPNGQRIEERFDTESRLNAVAWLDNGETKPLPATRGTSATTPLRSRFDPLAHLLEFDLAGARFGVRFEPDGHALTLPTGAEHRERLDDFGRVVLQEGPERGRRVALYDAADNTLEVRDAERVMSARYDAAGRLIERRHRIQGQGEERVVRHVWAGAQRVRIEDKEQTSHSNYDAQGRLVSEWIDYPARDGLPAQSHATRYHYDALDRLSRTELPEGAVLVYHYDDIGGVRRIDYQAPASGWWQALLRRIWPEHGIEPLVADIEADSRNGLIAHTHGNGLVTRLERDDAGRLIVRDDGPVSTRLGYDERGRIAALARADQRLELEHDPLGRLLRVGGAFEQGFVLDANANRLRHRQDGTKTAYAYRPASDQLLARDGKRYTYNAVGEPLRVEDTVRGSVRTLEYDALGQIVRVEEDGRTLGRYRYNHARQRIAREVDGRSTRYLWQDDRLVAEADEAGRIRVRTFYQGSRPFAQVRYDERGHASLYAIHTDHLGTALAVTDQAGRTVWQADYDVYGRASVRTHSLHSAAGPPARAGARIGNAHAASATDFDFSLRLPGQFEDSETGWHYNLHRYYDPQSGRYLTPDPIGLDGGPNLYAYAGASPAMLADPLGLDWEMADGAWPQWLERIRIGQVVHTMFTDFVVGKNEPRADPEWSANVTLDGTFGSRRPDAINTRTFEIWELKPLSNRGDQPEQAYLRTRAEAQIADYLRLARRDPGPSANPRNLCSPEWMPGIGADLFENGMELGYFQLGWGPFRRVYRVHLWHDTQPGATGLVFYTYEQVENPMGELLEEILRALAEGPGFWVLPGPGRIPVPRPIP